MSTVTGAPPQVLLDAWTEAQEHHRAGRMQQAAIACGQVLESDPGSAPALHLLGLIAAEMGERATAVALLERAAHLAPSVAAFHSDLGVAYRQMGRTWEARACYERATRIDPDFTRAYFNLGNLLRDEQDDAAAAEAFAHAAAIEPAHAAAWERWAACLGRLGRQADALHVMEQAVARIPHEARLHQALGHLLRGGGFSNRALDAFAQAATLNPASASAQNDAGAQLLEMERAVEAESYFRNAIALAPELADLHLNLGRALRDQKRFAEAEACFRHVSALDPNSAAAFDERGIALSKQGGYAEAEDCFAQALKLGPDRAESYCNLGHMLLMTDRFAEAQVYLRRAVELKPDFAEAWNNLGGSVLGEGLLRRDAHQLDEAEGCYQRALTCKPDYVDVHVNSALLALLRGRFAEGWAKWEWRRGGVKHAVQRFSQPRWQGENLLGRTILLHTEQGLGDTIQFIRYAALLKERGARVLLQCPHTLRALLAGATAVDEVTAQGETLPAFDVHCSLMSVPGLVGTTLETVPAPVPYLRADPDLVAFWRERLTQSADPSKLKVGIAWQGNPEYLGDRRRSIALKEFQPVAELAGVKLYSLQRGLGSEQLDRHREVWGIADLGLPFADAAAAMMSLDLVITSDTALAHLAGALGHPVWLALCCTPDWRWMLDREDTPWYSTMRLFRQSALGAWAAVFATMARLLDDAAVVRRGRALRLSAASSDSYR